MQVPDKIDCVDCGQPAYLLSHPPEDGWADGDYVAYRCSGCNDRWDLVVEASDYEGQGPGQCLGQSSAPWSADASPAGSRFEEARAVLEARRRENA